MSVCGKAEPRSGLGADPKCWDIGRILRPPGTLYHKTTPPREVALERWDRARAVTVDGVLADAPEIAGHEVEARWRGRIPRDAGGDRLLQIPPRVYVSELLGSSPGRNGKVACPFHRGERASLHVYTEPARGWCCFSCGRGGSIYDLAAALWGFQTRGRDFILLRRQLQATFDCDRGLSR